MRSALYGAQGKNAAKRVVVAKAVGNYLAVGAFGLDFFEGRAAYSDRSAVERHLHAIGRSALSLAGGVTGATSAGKLGISAGSMACGVPCAAIGGTVFALGGAVVGSGVAKMLWDNTIGRL